MKKNLFIKVLLVSITLLITSLGVGNLIFAQEDGSLVSTKDTGQLGDDTEREIISLLLELRAIKLDSELFESNVFKSLKDFGVVLEPEPVGRVNPFAPLGAELSTTIDPDPDNIDDLNPDDLNI